MKLRAWYLRLHVWVRHRGMRDADRCHHWTACYAVAWLEDYHREARRG